jgi:hypothetical protein
MALCLETLQYLDNSLGLTKAKLRDTVVAALRAAVARD